jgi:hypothetical protein
MVDGLPSAVKTVQGPDSHEHSTPWSPKAVDSRSPFGQAKQNPSELDPQLKSEGILAKLDASMASNTVDLSMLTISDETRRNVWEPLVSKSGNPAIFVY